MQGQLSDIQRKNCEAIALKFDQCPRTLQRFPESIKWDESDCGIAVRRLSFGTMLIRKPLD